MPPHILVVDDDPQILQFVSFALEDEGYSVETAADGREAADLISVRRPSLIVLDMMLPRLDGYGLAEELRAQPGPELPILVMTADGRAREKAERVGAFAYVQKPFELDTLIDLVNERLAS